MRLACLAAMASLEQAAHDAVGHIALIPLGVGRPFFNGQGGAYARQAVIQLNERGSYYIAVLAHVSSLVTQSIDAL